MGLKIGGKKVLDDLVTKERFSCVDVHMTYIDILPLSLTKKKAFF